MISLSYKVAAAFVVLVGSASARQDPPDNGALLACHGQHCDNCGKTASINEGYPDCLVYPSDGNLDGFEASNGHGYDVWWDSGPPNPGCKIIVRTPASQDISNCGYYLSGWKNEGCYYTRIDQSFMLQYCCGTGDCEAASPSASVQEAHARMLQGVTSSVSLKMNDMSEMNSTGKRDLGNGMKVAWNKRSPSSGTQFAKSEEVAAKAANKKAREVTESGGPEAALEDRSLQKRKCKSYGEGRRYTKAGTQTRVSRTQNCNANAGCDIDIDTSVTTGRTVSASVGFNLFEILSASTGIMFTKQKSRTLSETFKQDAGTTGYVTFIPTFICTEGKVSDCKNTNLHDGDDVTGCTPRLIGSGDRAVNDGTYSFVYT